MVSFAEIESKAPELQVAAGDGQDSKPEQHEEAPRQLNPGITVPTTNKKKRGKKTAAARGPGALAKNRGNGFEGRSPGPIQERRIDKRQNSLPIRP